MPAASTPLSAILIPSTPSTSTSPPPPPPPLLPSIPLNHLKVGFTNIQSYSSLLQSLLSQRAIPAAPFTPLQIQYLLAELSLLDTNNAPSNLGVGEREGRVFSTLLQSRPCAHGIGRSGDLLEPQPKSVGTSILIQITYICLASLLKKTIGLTFVESTKNVIILPMCTGKSMEHALLSLVRARKEERATAEQATEATAPDVVLWCRIDQKSCLKSIISAGLTPVVVSTTRVGDLVTTSLTSLTSLLSQYSSRVAAVITTTSCFAPRACDPVDEIAKICEDANTPHVINNAYGLQVSTRGAEVAKPVLAHTRVDKGVAV